ncbi:MAG TPA: M20/M25/M40 family metallo-hydrolase [Bacteroidia bacterium]|jgi:hypothetical protein
MKQLLLTFCILHFTLTAFSQEIKKGKVYEYARKIVDTMASGSFHGRGYVNDGDKKAACFLSTEFKSLGVQPFTGNYFQQFSFPVNTFQGQLEIKADDKVLVPGRDYILFAASPSVNGVFPVIMVDEKLAANPKKLQKLLKRDLSSTVVVVNDTGARTKVLHDLLGNGFKAKAIVALKDKLTYTVSQTVSEYPIIEILRTSFKLPKRMSMNIENKFIPSHQSQNVAGFIKGSEYPDSFIVFSAHYDHLGQMGKDVYFPGANDNASGCAMLLSLARHFAQPANQPKHSVAFIAFAGEEAGLMGSGYYTEHPLFPLKNIRFLLNMDIMGTGEDGITVVNGSVFKTEFDELKRLNENGKFIPEVKIRGKASNSDHFHFSEKDVKAFFIYTMGGIKAYHDIYDRPETLPLNEFEDLFQLIIKFNDYLQN